MRIRIATCLVAASIVAFGACGDTTSTVPTSLALDRPMDVAFGCFGGVRITGGGRAGTTADPIAETAVPIADCDQFANTYSDACAPISPLPPAGDPNAPILGQEDLSSAGVASTPQVAYFSFILQSVPGTVAVATWTPKPAKCMIAGDVHVLDIDTTTPGSNGLSVGDTPIGIVTDDSGCYEVTANSGTCDLSTIDITSVLKAVPSPVVTRADVTNAAGAPILARPAAIATTPPSGTVGVACPATPQGIAYVAYPDCHRVAAIDLSTNKAVASIVLDATGHATIDPAGGNFTCPAQCGVGDPITDGARPTSLDLVDDPRVDTVKAAETRRLAIGVANSNIVTVVDLDANHLPTAVSEIALDGPIGVNDVALTPQIGMGGDSGDVSDDPSMGGAQAGQFQFVYAVATDGTVRVADMLSLKKECDTELDPRFLTTVTDASYLACMPLGDPRNPQRRDGARGPGIQLIGDARPVAVSIVHAVPTLATVPTPGPDVWYGYFAAVTSTTGAVYMVNIDDDNYPDVDDPTKPVSRWLGLALPHQIRDRVAARDTLSEAPDPDHPDQNVLVCDQAGSDPDASTDVTTFTDGPHLWPTDTTPNHPIAVATSNTQIHLSKIFQLPTIHQVMCTGADETIPVSELGFAAPADVRKNAFPDLQALRSDETWLLTWEGTLSNDSALEYIDGPIVRQGQTIVDGTGLRVEEQSHPYCAIGVEPYDEVVLRGCDPNATGQCGFGNTCYVHPNSTTGVGSCLPTDQVDSLSDPCREFLISERHYAVDDAKSGALHLIPRRHVLRTTPLTGCMTADQCGTLEGETYRLAHSENPVADTAPLDPLGTNHEVTHTWACEADPSRPGPDQCVMSCTPPGQDAAGAPTHGDLDCDAGTVCDPETLRCVEGVVPPLQCLTTLQRYEVHAGRAFSLIGSRTGYVHSIIADASGQCVRDPVANPLRIGRIPLTTIAPCLVGDGLEDLSPNPCSTTVTQAELALDYAARTGDPTQPECQLNSSAQKVVSRDTTAIRFRNASMTFEIVDPTYKMDKTCIGDRAGGVELPLVFPGYAMQFRIASGFLPYLLGLTDTVYPINVVRGPLESIWVLDEGDFLSAVSASTRGAVYRVESTAPAIVNTLQ